MNALSIHLEYQTQTVVTVATRTVSTYHKLKKRTRLRSKVQFLYKWFQIVWSLISIIILLPGLLLTLSGLVLVLMIFNVIFWGNLSSTLKRIEALSQADAVSEHLKIEKLLFAFKDL